MQNGEVINSVERFMERLFLTGVDNLFDELGYSTAMQGQNVKFADITSGKVIATVDFLLEDSEYAIVVDVNVELEIADIDNHIDRIAVIRNYFNERGDKRILIGAVAGGIVHDNVLKYAQKNGLYVITQGGDSGMIADLPEGFKPREW